MLLNAKSRQALIALALLLIAGIIALIIALKNPSVFLPASQKPGQRFPNGIPEPAALPLPPEEDEIYGYTGKILSISEDEQAVTILTNRGEKKIRYSAETNILRENKPFAGGLAVGMMITANSASNIRGLTDYAARTIFILN